MTFRENVNGLNLKLFKGWKLPNVFCYLYVNRLLFTLSRYFYTRNVQEIDLAEMPPTFVAANKYLVCDLIRDLADHITRSCLDVSNAFLIYDQLLQLAIDDPLVNDIKFRIQTGFSEACADDIFNQIDKNTLIDILKFNWLNIAEMKLLKACLRRTDSEVARRHSTADQASKRATFESIKHLIRFGDLSLSDFGSVKEIQNYLTIEETASVRLYLSQRSNPIQIDYRSPRRPPPEVKIIKDIEIGRLDAFRARSLTTVIRSNRRICITSITTFGFTNYITGLNFGVYKDKKPVSSDAKIVASPNQSYIIHLALLLEPNTPYELRFAFTFNSNHAYHQVLGISNKMTFNSDESGFEFKIEPNSLGYHCIKSIGFVSPE